MRIHVGAGWKIKHLTDRTVELEKDSAVYRRFTDRDGFVLVRVDPTIPVAKKLELALQEAMKQDEKMALRVAKQLMPSGRALENYRKEQRQLAGAFGIPGEEPSEKVYRP